jgi:hypothetical protein
MKPAPFVLLGALLFAVTGPLVPMVSLGVERALETGSTAALASALALSPLSYLLGAGLAFFYGVVTSLLFVTAAAVKPGLPAASWPTRLLAGIAIGSTAYMLLSLIVGEFPRHLRFVLEWTLPREGLWQAVVGLWRLERPRLQLFGTPTLTCALLTAALLLPKLEAPKLLRT